MMRNWDGRNQPASTGEASAEAAVPGVIDTLGLGYAALVVKPLAMLPLLLLDLSILFAPRVSLKPLGDTIGRLTNGWGRGSEDARRGAEWLSGYNVVELASLQAPLIRTPAVIPSMTSERMASYGWHLSYSSPLLPLIGLTVVTLAAGVVMSVLFRLLVAAEALGIGSRRDVVDARLVGSMSLRFTACVSVLVGLVLLIGMPVVIVTGLGLIFGFGGAQILWLFMLIPVAWGFVHFYFSIHALFVDRSGPFEALRSSYRVVRGNFWQSVQFIATTMLIMTGVTFVLQQVSESIGGVIVAVTINTFVATGIVVAAMLFYRDRARILGVTDYASGR
jgi:hypothetical protein